MNQKLRLIVNFAGQDRLSGRLRSITAHGREGSRILAEMKGEARKAERELRDLRGEIAQGVATGRKLSDLVERERQLAAAARQANQRFEEQERRLQKITAHRERWGRVQQATGKAGAYASAAITLPAVAFARGAFQKAVDNEELESAYAQTFGNQTSVMDQWAARTAATLGRTQMELKNAANTFGIFFNQVTPDGAQSAAMSQKFSVLAQDLASFYNTDEQTALDKLRSGLTGEAEPLRDFGVFLSAATVQQQAYKMGLAKTGEELTEQQKIQARYALILASTTNAQGDVLRTQDSTANRLRAANSAWTDLQITVGEKLIPALTPAIGVFADLINKFSELSPETQKWIVVAGVAAAALGPLLLGISAAATGIRALIGPIMLMNSGWKAFKVAKEAGKFTRIASLARGAVPAMLSFGKAALTMGWGFLRAGLLMLANPAVLAITLLVVAIGAAAYLIYRHWDTIKLAFATGVAALGRAWEWIKSSFSAGIVWLQALPAKMASFGRAMIEGLVNGIMAAPGKVWNALKSIVLGGLSRVRDLLQINSPSRVFMRIGGYVSEGMAQGIDRGGKRSVRAAQSLASRVATAGLASASLAVAPVTRAAPSQAAFGPVTITIHAAPGQSEEEIGQAAIREMRRQQEIARASAFQDDD